MDSLWIIIEIVAALTECGAILYFINSRFDSKLGLKWAAIAVFFALCSVDIIFTFAEIQLMEIALIAVIIAYLLLAKKGSIAGKVFCAISAVAIAGGSVLAANGIIMIASGLTTSDLLEDRETPRFVVIVLSRIFQVLLFWVFSRRNVRLRLSSKIPAIILAVSSVLTMLCLLMIYMLSAETEFTKSGNILITLITLAILIITIIAFLLYEVFVKEESEQLDLVSRVSLMESEQSFYKQIDAMYSDMRQWRHDYKNHIITLKSLLQDEKTAQAIAYLNDLLDEPTRSDKALNTGNLILDSIVSAKLTYAESLNIDTALDSTFPEKCQVSDADLCSIIGNLLDNAIEACERINDGKRFIDLSLSVKKKMLMIITRNSYAAIDYRNGKYISSKSGAYHGQGMKHIDELVQKYQGFIVRQHENNVFLTQIMLPLEK